VQELLRVADLFQAGGAVRALSHEFVAWQLVTEVLAAISRILSMHTACCPSS
jgi:hypothetical protein